MEAMNWISCDQLTRWSHEETNSALTDSCSSLEGDSESDATLGCECHSVHYDIDPHLNSVIALWHGDPLRLDVDALAHATNERFERLSPLTDRLYHTGGPQLMHALFNRIRQCPVGSVRITPGYGTLARYIVHTASPRYRRQHRDAAERALFRCYYHLLHSALKYGWRSIALGSLSLVSNHYPMVDGVHCALRVIRHFLQLHPTAFDLIVLSTESNGQHRLYRSLVPLYFPRNQHELRLQQVHLPPVLHNQAHKYGKWGEPLHSIRAKHIETNGDSLVTPNCNTHAEMDTPSSSLSNLSEQLLVR